MAGGLQWSPSKAFAAGAKSVADHRMVEPSERDGLSPRQRELAMRWRRFTGRRYDDRSISWDGSREFNPDETEQIATAGYLPNGFVDTSGATLPLRYRKPSAPYCLYRVIVKRFTGLLFGKGRIPRVSVPENGNKNSSGQLEDFVRALIKTSRFWPAMKRARNYAGAQGTVAMGFQVVDGVPMVEVHDARWLQPKFVDRLTLKLKSVEKKFQYPVEVYDTDEETWVTKMYWYRRVIDDEADTTYAPVLVDPEKDPVWTPAQTYEHGYGFCPVVWVQNSEVDDDIDGATDCEGAEAILDELDAVNSQVGVATKANTDPTLGIFADGEVGGDEQGKGGVQTGSDNVIKTGQGGSASFIEISGTSITIGLNVGAELRRQALEVTQCVLDSNQPDATQKTATEINKNYASMLSKAADLQEQWGDMGILALLHMMLQCLTMLAAKTDSGVRLRGWKGKKDAEGFAGIPDLPDGGVDLDLDWPGFFDPSVQDSLAAAQAASLAKSGGTIDKKTATEFVAPYFGVDDPDEVLANAEAEAQEEQDRAQDSIDSLNAGSPKGKPPAKLGLVGAKK